MNPQDSPLTRSMQKGSRFQMRLARKGATSARLSGRICASQMTHLETSIIPLSLEDSQWISPVEEGQLLSKIYASLSAIQRPELGVGYDRGKCPDPTESVFPRLIVNIGNEVVDAISLACRPGLISIGVVVQGHNGGQQAGAAGGIAA